MNSNNLVHLRLINQQIIGTKFKTVKDIVGWMGAIQAQDYNMAKWAIGVRLPGSTDKMIEESVDKGDIIRTHLLRPTWHFVSADDIYWMLELTAPQIKATMKSRNKILGLTESIFIKSNDVIKKALTGNKHLTRDEILDELINAKIITDNSLLSHLLMQAELDGIICSGATRGKRITYALLEERVPKTKSISRNEALVQLARKYFTSHGPATLHDFVWWSGLSVADAKSAMELLGKDFIYEEIDSQKYWFSNSGFRPQNNDESFYLLPAFDEFIISYKDRGAALPYENSKKAVSDNGIFRPVIVVNGEVKGLWKRTIKNNKIIIETHFFQPAGENTTRLLEMASTKYGLFLEQDIEIIEE